MKRTPKVRTAGTFLFCVWQAVSLGIILAKQNISMLYDTPKLIKTVLKTFQNITRYFNRCTWVFNRFSTISTCITSFSSFNFIFIYFIFYFLFFFFLLLLISYLISVLISELKSENLFCIWSAHPVRTLGAHVTLCFYTINAQSAHLRTYFLFWR